MPIDQCTQTLNQLRLPVDWELLHISGELLKVHPGSSLLESCCGMGQQPSCPHTNQQLR